MRRHLFLALIVGALVPSAFYGAQINIKESHQLILVIAENWNDDHAVLSMWQRDPKGWRREITDTPVMLGRNGLGWGVGLHEGQPSGPLKREGDGRSPAGIFELDKIYGRDPTSPSNTFPYSQLRDTSEGIDDPASRYYNRIVDSARLTKPDWRSSEKLRPTNPMFRWIVNVKHNWSQQPGLGSCIYLHIWKAPGVATSGCSAMSAATLEKIVRVLDQSRRPLLVQLTRDDYARSRDDWALP